METTRVSGQSASTPESRSTKAAGKAESKTAASQDGTQPGADAGGFSLLLAALGQDDPQLGTGAPQDLLAADPAQDMAALVAWQPGLLPGVHAAPQTQQGAVGAEGLAIGAGMGSLVGQTAMIDGGADAAVVNGTQAPTGGQPWRPDAGRFHSTLAAAAGEAPARGGAPAADGVSAGAALRGLGKDEHKTALPEKLQSLVAAAVDAAERREGAQGAGPVPHRGMEVPSAAAAPGMLAGVAEESRGTESRSMGRGGEESASSGGAHSMAGVGEAGPEVPGADAFSSDMSAAADPTQAGLEDQLAEQVAFWVHQKTQNAEMTLDRDGQPVGVTVSLNGNEAHVAFRSDQAQTRDMLDASMSQLRELLQREGLQLSGMTVDVSGGQSSRDGSGAREGGREGVRQATVHAAAPAGMASRAGFGNDRGVDIFV